MSAHTAKMLVDGYGFIIPNQVYDEANDCYIQGNAGRIKRVAGSLIRPNDTTAYSALDCINDSSSAGTLQSIENCARISGGAGYIVYARLTTNNKNNTARHKVHIYSQSVSAVNDNAGFPILWANRAKKVCEITLDAMSTENSGASDAANVQKTDLFIPFECAAGSRSLYYMIETLDARTPSAQEEFYLELGVDQS